MILIHWDGPARSPEGHSILLVKLDSTGLDSNSGMCSVMWFKSYLSDRMQQVDVGGCYLARVVSRVPQGSILGPMLFLVYVNDIAMACHYPLLYADDTVLLSHQERV